MESPETVPKANVLNSWKEIAACLGVTVRSVQRWEQTAGLPVHRMGAGARARVFAYSDELLNWQRSRGAEPEAEPAAIAPTRRRLLYAAAGLAVLLATAGGLAWRLLPLDREPSEWAVERSTLTIANAGGHVLWELRLPVLSGVFDTEKGDKALLHDLDGDGRKRFCSTTSPITRQRSAAR